MMLQSIALVILLRWEQLKRSVREVAVANVLGMPIYAGQSPVANQGYDPTAFSQVMQTEPQFQPSQLYGRQTQ